MNHFFPSQLTHQELQTTIQKADAAFESSLLSLSQRLRRCKGLRFLGLTGPTCSGKTTAARMLTERLEFDGRHIHVISIDDFYFEKSYLRALTEQKGIANLDYDSEDTIDVALLGECVSALREGRETCLPHFNFLSGLRERGVRLTPMPDDLFLFEGIQILYPKVHAILHGDSYRCIAICPVSGITVGGQTFSPDEIRLMRRLVRDELYRGASAEFTLSLWESVRANEEENILPNIGTCFATVDSTMPYEIGVLKPYLENSLKKVPANDPHIDEAKLILEKIRFVETVDSSLIAPKSLYREFI